MNIPRTRSASPVINMVRWMRRLSVAASLAVVNSTQGFVQSPRLARVPEFSKPGCFSSASAARPASTSTFSHQSRDSFASQGFHRGVGNPRCRLFAAQQSIDGGVLLPPAEEVDEYARFLSDAVRQHLDNEWIPQECHKEIGEEVARLYHAAINRGDTDMTTLVMETGSGMEKFDMADAFVGPWDIANLVSDFLMQKMGAEVSGCSSKIPVPPSSSITTFRLKTDNARRVKSDLSSDFSRYRFLVDFMDDDESKWEEMNTIVALYQGYTPEDADDEGAPGVRWGWAQAFPGPSPPDLSSTEGVVEALEADFPEDPDLLKGLEVIVETVYGGEVKRMNAGDPENGIPPNPVYLRRSTVCKWLYLMGFLQDDIKRAPDDPDELAELIEGRARLKSKTKGP